MKTKMTCLLFVGLHIFVIIFSMPVSKASPIPSRINPFFNHIDEIPEEVLMNLVERFGKTMMKVRSDLENSKRTVDFGLARGFSGTQEAKHRMGLAAANFPGGPGRKRRSESLC